MCKLWTGDLQLWKKRNVKYISEKNLRNFKKSYLESGKPFWWSMFLIKLRRWTLDLQLQKPPAKTFFCTCFGISFLRSSDAKNISTKLSFFTKIYQRWFFRETICYYLKPLPLKKAIDLAMAWHYFNIAFLKLALVFSFLFTW